MNINRLSVFIPIILILLLLTYPLITTINYYFNIVYLVLIPGIPLLVKNIFQFFQGKPMYLAVGKSNNVFYRYFYFSISIILLFLATLIFFKLFV